ncbi:MAG: hypothetical protein Q4E81_06880 [Succinatimonas sp.]|nr:hypothetical protein [Succinatimonas sp.]
MKLDYVKIAELFEHLENENLEAFLDGLEDSDEYLKHLDMLVKAGYVDGVEVKYASCGILYSTNYPRITLDGYEFANIVKDKKLFPQVVKAINKAGYVASIAMIKEFAPHVIKNIASLVFAGKS